MSTLLTRSQFYFGHLMTSLNQNFDFKEGSDEFTAILPLGDMTLNEFVDELETQMNLVGGQVYTITLNRTTRVITIAAPGTFEIRIDGPFAGTSGWLLAGFNANRTGSNSYVGNIGSGSKYETQYKFFKYLSPDDMRVLESSAVTQSARGDVQVISFGDGRRMECEIKPITNLDLENEGFNFNATGLADARTFLDYITRKSKVEFMPDVADPETYYEILLDSTDYDKNGTGFALKNIAPDMYTSGLLKWRGVIR